MDELEKLFAEASASVLKATTPRKEPEAPPPTLEPVSPPPVAAAAAPPPPPPVAPPAGAGPFQVITGAQTDAHLALEVEGISRELTWTGCQLALGRVGTVQMVAVTHASSIYLIPQDKANFKTLVRQLQADSVSNWRRLVVELAERIPSSDVGVTAITSGGGMIPKYATVEAFVDQVRAGG